MVTLNYSFLFTSASIICTYFTTVRVFTPRDTKKCLRTTYRVRGERANVVPQSPAVDTERHHHCVVLSENTRTVDDGSGCPTTKTYLLARRLGESVLLVLFILHVEHIISSRQPKTQICESTYL